MPSSVARAGSKTCDMPSAFSGALKSAWVSMRKRDCRERRRDHQKQGNQGLPGHSSEPPFPVAESCFLSPRKCPEISEGLQTGGRHVSGATEQGSLPVRRDLLYRSPSEESADGGHSFGLPCSSTTSDFEPGGRT